MVVQHVFCLSVQQVACKQFDVVVYLIIVNCQVAAQTCAQNVRLQVRD